MQNVPASRLRISPPGNCSTRAPRVGDTLEDWKTPSVFCSSDAAPTKVTNLLLCRVEGVATLPRKRRVVVCQDGATPAGTGANPIDFVGA